jgi:hypothetical protein
MTELVHKQNCDVLYNSKIETRPRFSLICQKLNEQLITPLLILYSIN